MLEFILVIPNIDFIDAGSSFSFGFEKSNKQKATSNYLAKAIFCPEVKRSLHWL